MSVAMATKANIAPMWLLHNVEYQQTEKASVGFERVTLFEQAEVTKHGGKSLKPEL